MKIIVDENISFGFEAFSTIGSVTLMPGRGISNEALKNADALVVRSITEVNESLLKGTNIKFVGTATIGTDHIDLEYLKKNNITFTSAAGCNSHAVKEYVFNAIFSICVKYNFSLKDKSIGIIGVGNIGSKNAAIAESLGLKVFKNDPPLERLNPSAGYCSLQEALSCDIVTFHVPLNKEGIDKTVHLLNESNIELIKPGAILINSSRGPVVDNEALKKRMNIKKDLYVVLDVWEKEPDFDTELLKLIEYGSPHVAGYSLEGKVNGTVFVYEALCNYCGINPVWSPTYPPVNNHLIKISGNRTLEKTMHTIFTHAYKIEEDDSAMRKITNAKQEDVGKQFDFLRKDYRFRRELNNYRINNFSGLNQLKESLSILRLQLEN
ncbi:MAG: 4-phosphoerythronate dehydrogenase [Bacteroidetes bacterium]|nr:4-phosphoerythronate dehydrogenase [Bacteroidota bacterium]